jgi:ABC-2 type transport system permease protein
MGIGQVITMPLFFASNAIYPVAIMPDWLKVVAHINPLTYQVDALRSLMLIGGTSMYGLSFDISILIISLFILIVIGAKIYPNVAR